MIISLKNIPIIASVGIYENERKNPTKIIISAVINYNFSKNSVVVYDLILQHINEIAKSKHFFFKPARMLTFTKNEDSSFYSHT
jgi:dihydroneopterin aldolase